MSGPNCDKSIMPLNRMAELIAEFKDIDFSKSDFFVIGGGESMAPYIFGNNTYMHHALSMIYESGGIPTIKTNAIWGNNKSLRHFILKDLADTAYTHQIVTTLDISVDEFHKNTTGVTNIISDIIDSKYLAPAIRIFLVGFNTDASKLQLNKLQYNLKHNGIYTYSDSNKNYDFSAMKNDYGIKIFTSFETPIYMTGRAIKTKTYTTGPSTGLPDSDGHCLMVDYMDNATLNYKFREHIAGRDLNSVTKSLMNELYTHQR